jgi:O-antigen ligase
MLVNCNTRSLVGATAAVVTTAAFAKVFLPFYLIGSTAVFVATGLLGLTLIAIKWRPLGNMAGKVPYVLLPLALLYAYVIADFLWLSRPVVPNTHLLGILIFHSLFMIFGFAAARGLKAVLLMLLAAAAFYAVVFVRYTVQFGDPMRGGFLNDVLGVGDWGTYVAFHQKIGTMMALAALAALGLASNRIRRIAAFGTLPLVLLFLFYISARTALVALGCSLMFWAGAALWTRSKKLALLGVVAITITVTLASYFFYQHALQNKDVDAAAPDAINRTIREIQDPRPLFRLQIWQRAWHQIASEPDRLLFGRGIGIFPVNEGVGAPDWLLRRTEGSKLYPHNVHLEMLYETGIVGLLLFCIATLLPLVISLRRWHLLSLVQKSAVSMYVFQLAGSEFSGSFAFDYLNQFFFALTVGIIALTRNENALAPALPPPEENLEPRYSAHVRA